MTLPPNESSDLVAAILADYLDSRNSARNPNLEEFIQRCPENKREELRQAILLTDIGHEFGRKPPKRLGDFELIGEIGRGGMGVVYEARQISLDRSVALKFLAPWIAKDNRFLGRFHREARAAASLAHPGIVSIHGISEQEGFIFYSMDLVPGCALDKEISSWRSGKKRLQRNEIVKLFVELAHALDYAHQHKVIHRDIKPGNLILVGDQRVVIADFGLAQMESAAGVTRTGELFGTPNYMSPEQVNGPRGGITAQSDIYSLGATLFEVLTLERSIQGESAIEVIAAINARKARTLRSIDPTIPRELEAVVAKCLEWDPANRYRSAKDLASDLQQFLDGKPIVAQGWTKHLNFIRRHPATTITVIFVLLVVGVSILLGGPQVALAWSVISALALAGSVGVLFERQRVVSKERNNIEYDRLIQEGISKRLALPALRGGIELEGLHEMHEIFDHAIELNPERPEAYYHRSQVWEIQKNDNFAEADLDKALALDAEFVPALFERSIRRFRAGKIEEAEEILGKAQNLPSARGLRLLSDAYRNLEQLNFAEAAKNFLMLIDERFFPYSNAEFEFRLRRAIALDICGDSESAREEFLFLRGLETQELEISRLLARTYLKEGTISKAQHILESIAKQQRRNGNLRPLSDPYFFLSTPPNAMEKLLKAFKEISGLYPEQFTWLRCQAFVYFRLGKLSEAEGILRQLSQRGETTNCLIGYCYALQRRWRKAAFESEIEHLIYGPNPASLLNRSWICHLIGDLNLALESTEQSIVLNPYESMAHANRAACLEVLGRFDEAISSAREAVRLNPLGSRSRAALIAALVHLRQFKEAKELALQHCQLMQDSCSPLRLLGQIFLCENQDAEAIRLFEDKSDLPLLDRDSLDVLKAQIAAKHGDFDESLKLLRLAVFKGTWTSSEIRRQPFLDRLSGQFGYEEMLMEVDREIASRVDEGSTGRRMAREKFEHLRARGELDLTVLRRGPRF